MQLCSGRNRYTHAVSLHTLTHLLLTVNATYWSQLRGSKAVLLLSATVLHRPNRTQHADVLHIWLLQVRQVHITQHSISTALHGQDPCAHSSCMKV